MGGGAQLLTREAFEEGVRRRQRNRCLLCEALLVDAHHILERKLWPGGGYYLSNRAGLCAEHYWDAEIGVIGVSALRKKAGIDTFVLPLGLT